MGVKKALLCVLGFWIAAFIVTAIVQLFFWLFGYISIMIIMFLAVSFVFYSLFRDKQK
jgi:hypothetical protein